MPAPHMKRFWDARAREDAYYFINNTLEYRNPDEEAFWASGPETLAQLEQALGASVRPQDAVLDIGCGVGRLTRALAQRARHVTGLDVSSEMLDRARELNAGIANIDWVLGDGSSLHGVASDSIDACLSFVVFQHIPDAAVTLAYVRDMGRVLRPGGWSAFQVSNDPDVHRQPARPPLRFRLRELLGREPRGRRDRAWLGSAIDLGDLRAAAGEAGMELERVSGEGTQFCLVLLRRR